MNDPDTSTLASTLPALLSCLGIVVVYLGIGAFIDEARWTKIQAALQRGKEIVGFLTTICAAADLGFAGSLFANAAGVPVVASSAGMLLVGASLIVEKDAWAPALGAGIVLGGTMAATII